MFNVYKLTCNKTGQDYYGSTEETVERRLEIHEIDYKRYLEGTRKGYCSSFEVIKNNDYKIEWLEECDDKIHMRDIENLYIDNFPCVNIIRAAVPGRTRKEYYEANREKRLEQMKEYNEEHKEKISEYLKEYCEEHKEEIVEYKKEWYENNKEKILERQKEYNEANKEKISEKRKEKYTCACGSTLRKDGKSDHERSIKHKKYLANL